MTKKEGGVEFDVPGGRIYQMSLSSHEETGSRKLSAFLQITLLATQ